MVLLPAGEVRTIRPPFWMDRLLPLVSAAVEGDRVLLPGGCRLRCADLGAVVLAHVRTPAGAVAWTLTLHRDDPAGRAWAHLRAVRPDLPPHMPAPWCAATPHAGMAAVLAPLFCRPGRCAM